MNIVPLFITQGRFSLAAKYYMNMGEICESELVDLERVCELVLFTLLTAIRNAIVCLRCWGHLKFINTLPMATKGRSDYEYHYEKKHWYMYTHVPVSVYHNKDSIETLPLLS